MKSSNFAARFSLMLIPIFSLILAANAQTGLVGYWKFDEVGGNTAYDSSGQGNNGTLVNGPTRTAGKIGGALDFDGTDDHVAIAANAALDNLGAVTFMAWIYPRVDAHWHVVDKGDGDKRLYSEGTSLTLDGRVRYVPTHAVSQSDSNTIVLNSWQHVAMTWSASSDTTRLYYNGTEVSYASQSIGAGTINNDSDYAYTVGARGALGAVTFFNGMIDEVRIYDRVLTAQEISSIHGAGTPIRAQRQAGRPVHLVAGPNPSASWVTISLANAGRPAGFCIYDLSGSLIETFEPAAANTVTWQANGIAEGFYLVKCANEGQQLTTRILLQR